ncbi:hypothetical protein ACFOLJ_27045 [Rugamonas sp. CCM 8940]|uniref:hypothetical protein n=1 Tax=Rugamonas sp. CCM 8940 TaxID=2765359 RepID=UPI0018F5220F|nr:hypothetical protein [Rugamonas sp. CCM 8940]MBJ7313610.1 hypothetical protein [Rugamonas sp. CCM 8940]
MFQNSKRAGRIAAILCGTTIFTACSTPSVNKLPTNASSNITALVGAAQDAQRASDALGWGRTVTLQQIGGTADELAAFTAAVCTPPFYSAVIAAKVFQAYNEQISALAAAPEASLGASIRNIRQLDEAIADIKKAKAAPTDYAALQAELTKKCGPRVKQDLAFTGQLQPSAIPLLPAVDALLALLAIPAKIAQIAETQKRAEAVKVYVTAHEAEITRALDLLGKERGFETAIQATRTYYARRAFGHYLDLAAYRANPTLRIPSPQLNAADAYTQFVVRYVKLQNVSGTALIEDPNEGLRVSYAAFIKAAREPNADPLNALDNFLIALQNISDLGSAVGDYKAALVDVSASN